MLSFCTIIVLTRTLLNGAGAFAVSRAPNVLEFSFAKVGESEICDVVMFIYLFIKHQQRSTPTDFT
jgi:hypothetical protein